MTERIRQLLDDAVAGLEPAHRDPLAAVVRRGRAARRKTAALAGIVTFALLAGGLVAGQRLIGATPQPAANGGVEQSATPRVVNGMVVAGAMQLPIPEGWKVVKASPANKCVTMARTILLIGSGNRGCQNAAVEVSRARSRNPGGTLIPPADGTSPLDSGLITPPVSITLAGGEPGWLESGLDSAEMKTGRYPELNYSNALLLPWSQVLVQLRMDGTGDRPIIESIRTSPRRSGVLTLPAKVGAVVLVLSDRQARVTAPGTVDQVLRLLRRQTDVVRDADACASPGQESIRLVVDPPDPVGASPASSGSPVSLWGTSTADATTVIIATGDGCQEAVSSTGGRVRLSAATLGQLTNLLGLGTR
ncbi:hypothetical protein [Actinoplanes sp. L3-i22]|uniref:hypothetical protein n=1 Tax=Actinoplanes sp. L3-i22 TaxID=2836373 RepID=UPI001C79A547|nr:hypothetical protein [Actinoplanes sp. L3-i22]BCY12011.1 hypothetical protein L3i22_070990 [Actinoplanes sp. L3-i22]